MKRLLIITAFCLMLFTTTAYALPNENKESDLYQSFEDIIAEQLNNLDTDNWEPFLKSIDQQGSDLLNGDSAKNIIAGLIAGNFSFGVQDIFAQILNALFSELMLNLMLMGKIIVIAVVCSIFKTMKESFHNPSVGEIGYFVCYSIVVILIIQSLISILSIGRIAIEQMVGFMQILFPILMTLLVAMGNFTSSAILQPAIALLVGIIGTFLKNIMLPLITLSAIITLINHIGEKVQLQRLGKLLNNLCIWTMTGSFTIFIGVLTVQGVMAASFDGISIRTAKFAIDTFVPIVGKMFSQTLDTIIGCSLLLKNAVGVAGLLIIGLLCITPGVKILALMFIYKLSSALLEPVTDKRIVDCLNGIGNILNVLFITVIGIAIMFFMTITLIIGTGNISVMLR
ncbi:MAG: stage III sporulation protein AE [Firmicutes bacterium]|nr:stage III sporulation protein AE [Bacillota bacterium]